MLCSFPKILGPVWCIQFILWILYIIIGRVCLCHGLSEH